MMALDLSALISVCSSLKNDCYRCYPVTGLEDKENTPLQSVANDSRFSVTEKIQQIVTKKVTAKSESNQWSNKVTEVTVSFNENTTSPEDQIQYLSITWDNYQERAAMMASDRLAFMDTVGRMLWGGDWMLPFLNDTIGKNKNE